MFDFASYLFLKDEKGNTVASRNSATALVPRVFDTFRELREPRDSIGINNLNENDASARTGE